MKHRDLLMLLVLTGFVPACGLSPNLADIGPGVTVLKAVRSLDTEPPPAWTVDPSEYASAAANTEHVLGVSFPRQTLAFATLEADRDARAQAARYVGEIVAAKLAEADEPGAGARLSPDAVVAETIRSAAAGPAVGRVVETHVERVSAIDRGRAILAYRVYRLRAVTRSALIALGKAAARPLAQETQSQKDPPRRKQLETIRNALETLSTKDFVP